MCIPRLHRGALVRRSEGREHRVAAVDLFEVAFDELALVALRTSTEVATHRVDRFVPTRVARYRNEGAFCEALAVKIRDDVAEALRLDASRVTVTLEQKARGRITITATA